MVVTVIAANFLLGLVCLAVAWGLWKLKRLAIKLGHLSETAEKYLYRKLEPAPGAIRKGQVGTRRLREKYQNLGLKVQQVQQILSFLSLLQLMGRWYPSRRRGKSSGQTSFNR
jgi:hypothetical protein